VSLVQVLTVTHSTISTTIIQLVKVMKNLEFEVESNFLYNQFDFCRIFSDFYALFLPDDGPNLESKYIAYTKNFLLKNKKSCKAPNE
jgi:hypothetical protein